MKTAILISLNILFVILLSARTTISFDLRTLSHEGSSASLQMPDDDNDLVMTVSTNDNWINSLIMTPPPALDISNRDGLTIFPDRPDVTTKVMIFSFNKKVSIAGFTIGYTTAASLPDGNINFIVQNGDFSTESLNTIQGYIAGNTYQTTNSLVVDKNQNLMLRAFDPSKGTEIISISSLSVNVIPEWNSFSLVSGLLVFFAILSRCIKRRICRR